MILAKACHDLDLLRWLADAPCEEVFSRGERRWFRAENAPEGAPERCTDGCPVEERCPYSAPRIYLERFAGRDDWPRSVVAHGDDAAVRAALASGPFGRCVYRCDNDVADHQVATLRFASALTATLTVTAFSEENTRTLRIFGSHGELSGHLESGRIVLRDFASGREERIEAGPADGHAEADRALVRALVARLRGDAGPGATDLAASIDSHLMAFAAERSRSEGGPVRPAAL
jgi:predicted dehydrogenase